MVRVLWIILGFVDAVGCGVAMTIYSRTSSMEWRNAAALFFIMAVICAAMVSFNARHDQLEE